MAISFDHTAAFRFCHAKMWINLPASERASEREKERKNSWFFFHVVHRAICVRKFLIQLDVLFLNDDDGRTI